ncbi:uncharacterized protein JCM6883_002679 [Sporobolomyces salmoneus]|uniref:uncharacterized protein n=1 Tax=Sporobolomyces salmoneus TaxID=183962 RepID=UPI0031709286
MASDEASAVISASQDVGQTVVERAEEVETEQFGKEDETSQSPILTSNKGKGKARGKDRDTGAYGSSPIQNLPFECLTHVFAHLPPRELGTCQLVCRLWNEVVGDETSWRTAFEMYYGVNASSLGRRIEPSSWRAEYIARVALMRLWHRSRTPTVTTNPSLGALSSIFIQLPSTTSNPLQLSRPSTPSRPSRDPNSPTDLPLLSLSLPLGAAIHSLPFTGKLSKRPLLSTPIDHLGRPLQNLALISTTSFAISPQDGSRLIWGMRDGSIRISNSTPTGGIAGNGGRGSVGSTIDQGEVRQIFEAHREGTAVQLVTFSNLGGTGNGKLMQGVKQRMELFVSIGKDGGVNVWSLNVPPVQGARERAPPAVKVWSSRWDLNIVQPSSTATANGGVTAAEVMRHRVKTTAVAFDSGWIGRHNGRPACLAIGRSDGKVIVWPSIDLPEGGGALSPSVEPLVIDPHEIGSVDTLIFDSPSPSNGSRSLLAHSEDSTKFTRYTFYPDNSFTQVVFGHPVPNQLSMITCLAVDFDEPPPLPLPSQPATPSEHSASISLVPPRLISLASSSTLPPLSRTNSTSILPSSAAAFGSKSFGRKKYVVAGDFEGRVYVWDWYTEPEKEGEIVAPSKLLQDLEIPDSGGKSSKVTALEITEAGVFIGGLDGTLRFYSTLGPPQASQSPVRTFRERSAPRHPSRMLAQGLIPEDDEERWLVSHIRANRDCVVAAIGGRILAWRTEAVLKKKGAPGWKTGKVTARQERFKANIELQHQVRESLSALSAESSARVERFDEEHRLTSQFGLPPSLDNFTEEEAIAFAMILSAEEEEKKLIALAMDNGKGREVEEEDSEWEQAPDEWLREDLVLDEDLDDRPSGSGLRRGSTIVIDDYEDRATGGGSHPHSPSTSLNVPSSPFLRGSSLTNGSPSPSPRSFSAYNWKPASAASSPSLSALGSPTTSNAKLQISPRLGPTYGSSFSNYANDPVPDMDPSLWPTAASTSTSPPPSSRKPSFASPSPSPSPSTSSFPINSSTSPPVAGSSSTPIRRGWSQVAGARASPSPSPVARASPSPSPVASSSTKTTPAAPSSLLSDQLKASQIAAEEEERERRRKREEEDLRFALELSLVEEASKLEI